jgi:hypothetical protein
MRRIGAAAIAALFLAIGSSAAVSAQEHGRDKRDDHGEQRDDHADHRNDRGRVSAQEQQQRIAEQQRRSEEYRTRLDVQTRMAQQENAQLQQARRLEQYRVQQQYLNNLQQQQAYLRSQRDYRNDPYFNTAPTYRYRLGTLQGQTNQYGVNMLRQAVNYGYQQGFNAGRADRMDRARPNPRAAYAYRDANYGYNGNYVAQRDYNAYFREGFQRGYSDGYNNQSQYGSFNNGTGSILGNVLNGILGLARLQ